MTTGSIRKDRLATFLLAELERESRSGFSRFTAIPDTRVQSTLAYWNGLDASDRSECLECLAVRGARAVGPALGQPEAGAVPHPFKDRLDQGRDAICTSDLRFQSVPTLRDVVSTFKIEKFRGARPTFPQAWFDYATSIQSVKAAELRKAVKLAFRALDLQKVEKMGGGTLKYVCRVEAQEIEVDIDYGGRSAQLRYQVTPAQLRGRGVFGWLTLERSLGLGAGDWDRITEDNLAASLEALCDCVRYAASLPARVEAWAVSDAP